MEDITKYERQLAKLTQEEGGSDLGKILSTAERLLALRPQHADALRCKAVCLIQQEKPALALKALDAVPRAADDGAQLLFYRAYCHYRLHEFTEALALLTAPAAQPLTTAGRHLLAQVRYNAEEYDAAAADFASLLADGAFRDEQDKVELLTNYTAALAAGGAPEGAAAAARGVAVAGAPTHDVAFNLAAVHIECRAYDEAMAALEEAERLCRRDYGAGSRLQSLQQMLEATEEKGGGEAGGDEGKGAAAAVSMAALREWVGAPGSGSRERGFFDEVGSIWAQMAYVLHQQRQPQRARRVLERLTALRPASPVMVAALALLQVAVEGPGDLNQCDRRLRVALQPRVASRLAGRQLLVARYNAALLLLRSKKYVKCRQALERMEEKEQQQRRHSSGKNKTGADLLHSLRLALTLAEGKKKKRKAGGGGAPEARSLIEAYVSESGTDAAAAATAKRIAAQLYLEHGDYAAAAAAVESPACGLALPAAAATAFAWRLQGCLDTTTPSGSGGEEGASASSSVAGAVAALLASLKRLRETDNGDARRAKAVLAWAVTHLLHGAAARRRSREAWHAAAVDLVREARAALQLKADAEVTALAVLANAYVDVAAARAEAATLSSSSSSSNSANPKAMRLQESMTDEAIEALLERAPERARLEAAGYLRAAAEAEAEGASDGLQGGAALAAGRRGKKKRRMRHPPRSTEGKIDHERWVPMAVRSYIKDLPPKRKRELKRLRALEQEQKRNAAEKRKAAAAAAAGAAGAAADVNVSAEAAKE